MLGRNKPNKLDPSDRNAIEEDIIDMLHMSGEIHQAIQQEVRDYINCPPKHLVNEFMNNGQIKEIIDAHVKSCLAAVHDDAEIIAEARVRNVEKVIQVLREHEGDLSDGYAFYGGDVGLRKVAEAIADVLSIGAVIQLNNVAYGMLLSRLSEVEKKTNINNVVIKEAFRKEGD